VCAVDKTHREREAELKARWGCRVSAGLAADSYVENMGRFEGADLRPRPKNSISN